METEAKKKLKERLRELKSHRTGQLVKELRSATEQEGAKVSKKQSKKLRKQLDGGGQAMVESITRAVRTGRLDDTVKELIKRGKAGTLVPEKKESVVGSTVSGQTQEFTGTTGQNQGAVGFTTGQNQTAIGHDALPPKRKQLARPK